MVCKDRLRTLRNWVSVWRSGAFDAEYYLRTYPDVARSRLGSLWHYCRHGWREGRNPNPSFNTRGYLAANPDVAAAGIDPFYHYIRFGRKEGRALVAAHGIVSKPKTTEGSRFALKRVPCSLSPKTLDAAFLDEMSIRLRNALYAEAV